MKIHYVSGSRADFGLMRETLRTLADEPQIDLSVVLTGQALISRYGGVEREVVAAGLKIAARVPVVLSGRDTLEMALAFAAETEGLTRLWDRDRPDLVLLLGDRGEMLAAAIAAYHLEIATGHIHGGERSGTLDEGFRHAISKLATWHFPATQQSVERLIRMGEPPETVLKIGAPGLVEVRCTPRALENWFFDNFGLPRGRRVALVVFHPVVQEADRAFAQTSEVLSALSDRRLAAVILRPNSDAGGRDIDRCLSEAGEHDDFVVREHLRRQDYLRSLAAADVLVGNSSSGIIESASLGTACVNIGSRQDGRERNGNVIDCPKIDQRAIAQAIATALELKGPFANVYGDGDANVRLRDILSSLTLGERAPKKLNAY